MFYLQHVVVFPLHHLQLLLEHLYEQHVQVLVLHFQFLKGIVKKLLKTTRNKKKKHNKIVMLARSKLNSVERKISEVLINSEISHGDLLTIINEERNC